MKSMPMPSFQGASSTHGPSGATAGDSPHLSAPHLSPSNMQVPSKACKLPKSQGSVLTTPYSSFIRNNAERELLFTTLLNLLNHLFYKELKQTIFN